MSAASPSPWRTVPEAAERARVGRKTIYRAIRHGQLRAARIGGRRELRITDAWIDAWLEQSAEPVEAPRPRWGGGAA